MACSVSTLLRDKLNVGTVVEQNEKELRRRAATELSEDYGTIESLKIRKIIMNESHKDEKTKVQKLTLGTETQRPTKIIMMVGATGSGKTTLINAMVNFIFRIQFEDDFRLILIDDKDATQRSQAESQTDFITAYVFYHLPGMPFNYNYVLIDTPGFGDTRGIQRDREMMDQLEIFLKQNYGVDQVDGIGFVTPSSAARLTQTQRYVYDGLSSMFGKDIKDNIYIMATFADAKEPPVLDALKEASIQFAGFYKFNNSAVYAKISSHSVNSGSENRQNSDSDSDDDDANIICELFWEMGIKSLHNFFVKLGKTIPASLTLTKEVLEERRKLQAIIVGLQNQIQLGLAKLSNLHQEKDMLARINDDLEGSRNYEEEVEVPKIEKVMLTKNECVTNCTKCNFTCHYPCYLAKTSNKEHCTAMTNGVCHVCPERCPWEVHFNMEFRFETSWVKEKRTVQELFDRYQKAEAGQKDKAQIIKDIEEDINKFACDLLEVVKGTQRHIRRLEEIALKPNPLSTKEYIDLLIESEKLQKRYHWEKRVKMLEMLKNEASILSGVRGIKSTQPSSGTDVLTYFQNQIHD